MNVRSSQTLMSPRPITSGMLIKLAQSVVKPRTITNGFTVGEVGCTLITNKGNVYLGTNIDASSGMGFCAEHSAIAAMITRGRGENRENRSSLKARRTDVSLWKM